MYIFANLCLVLSIIENEVVKSPAIYVELISPLNSVFFSCFDALLISILSCHCIFLMC